ncbi:hypothetical protein RJ035_004291 [Blastomyces gilchristii]
MVNTLDPDYLPVQESTKNPRSTLHRRRTHVKDIMMTLGPRADKPVCSREKPWLCEGKTCMNKYFQLCSGARWDGLDMLSYEGWIYCTSSRRLY